MRYKSKSNLNAAKLYAFFAQNIDPTCGAVLRDQQFLANQFGVTTKTIRNWLDYLEKENALVRIPVIGRVCAYVLNSQKVWKDYNTSKDYAAFLTKTLVNKDDEIKLRIISMFNTNKLSLREGNYSA